MARPTRAFSPTAFELGAMAHDDRRPSLHQLEEVVVSVTCSMTFALVVPFAGRIRWATRAVVSNDRIPLRDHGGRIEASSSATAA
jgi:hypothetical protein